MGREGIVAREGLVGLLGGERGGRLFGRTGLDSPPVGQLVGQRIDVGIGARALGIGRGDVTVRQVDREEGGRSDAQPRRVGYLGHRGGLGVEVVAAHGAFVHVHAHARRDVLDGGVLPAETEDQRVFVILDRVDVVEQQLFFIERDVEVLVRAPAHPLQIDGKLPLGGRTEAHGPRHVGRQGKFGGEGALIQTGNEGFVELVVDPLEHLFDLRREEGHLGRALLGFHHHFRAVGEADRPLLVDVPHQADIDPDGGLGAPLELGRDDRPVAGCGEQRGVLALPVGGQHGGDLRVGRRPHREQRARKIELAPRDHQPRADAELVPEFVGYGRLDRVGRQVDALNQVGAGPVVAPAHRGAVGGGEADADGQVLSGLVVEVGVQGRRNFIVRIGLDRLRPRVVVGSGVGHVGFDARDADRDVEFRALKGCGRRIEVDGFGVELHARSDVSHAGLLGTQGVYLIPFGRGRCRSEQAACEEEKSFHAFSFWFVLAAAALPSSGLRQIFRLRHPGMRHPLPDTKRGKGSETPRCGEIFWSEFL